MVLDDTIIISPYFPPSTHYDGQCKVYNMLFRARRLGCEVYLGTGTLSHSVRRARLSILVALLDVPTSIENWSLGLALLCPFRETSLESLPQRKFSRTVL